MGVNVSCGKPDVILGDFSVIIFALFRLKIRAHLTLLKAPDRNSQTHYEKNFFSYRGCFRGETHPWLQSELLSSFYVSVLRQSRVLIKNLIGIPLSTGENFRVPSFSRGENFNFLLTFSDFFLRNKKHA